MGKDVKEMDELELQAQLWHEFKSQCTDVDGIPEFEAYAAHRLAAVTAERDALRIMLVDVKQFFGNPGDPEETYFWIKMGDLEKRIKALLTSADGEEKPCMP